MIYLSLGITLRENVKKFRVCRKYERLHYLQTFANGTNFIIRHYC